MTPFLWVAVAVVATLSTARLTRLAVHDLFPHVRDGREQIGRAHV